MKQILTILSKLAKKYYDSKKISDIILFGSIARGKTNPTDIDVLVLFSEKVDKELEYAFLKEARKQLPTISIVSKTKSELVEESFDARESYLFEGISLLTKKTICSDFGFVGVGLFTYSLQNLTSTQKIQFFYALNGRKDKGFIHASKSKKISFALILTPKESIEATKEFLNYWKIEYKYIPALLPKRIFDIL